LIVQGEVLDLACGSGRHSRLLASMGYDVLAADRDPDLLSVLVESGIATFQCDLENDANGTLAWPFEKRRFSGVVVTNYLHRPLFPHIVESLMDNGVLIYETFAQGNEHFGKPSNPDFLLATGELLEVAARYALRVLAFEDGFVQTPKQAMVQRMCALKSPSARPMGDLRLI
jgi:SAM-dependent methyltransferase